MITLLTNEDNPICEGCGATIKPADPHQYNVIDIEYLREKCANTWQDFKDNPTSFYTYDVVGDYAEDDYGDQILHTAESAKPLIDAHLKNGGKLTDKYCLITPESSQRTLNASPASEAQALNNKDAGV